MKKYSYIYLAVAFALLILAVFTDMKWVRTLATVNLSSSMLLIIFPKLYFEKDTTLPLWFQLTGVLICSALCAVVLGASILDISGLSLQEPWGWTLIALPLLIFGIFSLFIITTKIKK